MTAGNTVWIQVEKSWRILHNQTFFNKRKQLWEAQYFEHHNTLYFCEQLKHQEGIISTIILSEIPQRALNIHVSHN
jgi:hypothetical protein